LLGARPDDGDRDRDRVDPEVDPHAVAGLGVAEPHEEHHEERTR